MTFAGRTAVVTGGASGIGRAAARRLAGGGATVVVTDVTDGAGRAVADGIGGTYEHLDVSDPDAWDALVARLDERGAEVDLAVLNAGIFLGLDDLTTVDVDDYLRLIGVNQHGVFLGLRALVPVIEAAGGGDVVVTASMAAVLPVPHDLAYTMSKHAVAGLVRAAAPGLERRGIRLNAICPATVDTGFLHGQRARLEELGMRVMEPEDVAEGMVEIVESGATGRCWIQPPGERPTPFEFRTP